MSKGISDLQEEILVSCLENGFLSTQDILRRVWAWEPQEWGSRKATIGESEYNAAHASLSRSLTRLWLRGLIVIWKNLTRYRTAITLTPEGETLARAILTETEESRIRG